MDLVPRLIVLSAGLMGLGPAVAALTVRSEYSANISIVRPTHLAQGVTTAVGSPGAPAANAVTVRGPVSFPGPQGATITGTAGSSLTLGGAARVVARALPVVGVAALAYSVYEEVRVWGLDGALIHDPGVPLDTRTDFEYRVACEGQPDTGACAFRALGDAITAGAPAGSANGPSNNCFVTWEASGTPTFPPGASSASVRYMRSGTVYNFTTGACVSAANGTFQDRTIYRRESVVTACPEATHPVTGVAYAWGQLTPGPDGQCLGGAPASISPDDAAAKLEAAPAVMPTAEEWKAIMDDVLGRTNNPLEIPSGTPAFIEDPVPAVVPGPTTTTTNAEGTTTTEVGFYGIPSTQPGFGRVNWTERRTVTRTDPEGNPIGTPEVTETTPSPETNPEPADCEATPDRVGCAELGQVEDSELEQREQGIEYEPDSGWGPATAACPAPQTFTVLGYALAINHQPICDALGMLRFVVIAAAGLAAAYIVVGGIQQ